jgi:hypothetical protein
MNHSNCFKRVKLPNEVVGVVFLRSRSSEFMNGQLVNVDGGQSMH